MKQITLRISGLLLMAITLTPAICFGEEPEHDALFRIERNTNANIVQYDARVKASGILDEQEPIAAYWIRLAEQGQTMELSAIQRKFVYGFKVKLDSSENTASMKLALSAAPKITVKKEAEDYQAITRINGVASYLEKIFIHATGKGLSSRLVYIELYGKAITDREEQYERIPPAR